MRKTEKLKLNMPDRSDNYNVEDFNTNFELLDKAITEDKSFLIEKVLRELIVSLNVDNWLPVNGMWQQTLTLNDIKATDNPIVFSTLSETSLYQNIKAYNKNFYYLYAAKTTDGSITFYAIKKPTITFSVGLKGV